MIFKTIVTLLIVLNVCSCIPQPSKSGLQIEGGPDQHLESKTGLKIDNGPNQGLNYTDTQGTKYSYRYITSTITNNSRNPSHLQLALSNEYDYPVEYGDQKFKVFLLPIELTLDKVTWDSLSYELANNELRNFFDRGLIPPGILNETLEPGDKYVITMGTLYPRPTNCGVVPNALFLQNNNDKFQTCDRLINQDKSSNPQLELGLKLDFYPGRSPEKCTIIPCGQISYLED